MRTFRTLASFLFIALFTSLSAQTNFSGFNYQAVVRDVNGDPLPNQSVSLRVHIHIGASSGYSETHSVTTDDHGLINVVMGEGTPEPGSALPTFGDLDWDGGVMLYEVGVDITGGTSYTTIGSGPLKAVPYAIHALTSGSGGSQPVDNDGDGWSPPYDRNDSNPAIKGAWDGGSSNIYNTNSHVGIGTATPDTNLHVVGKMKYQDGTQADKRILTSDADGNASWEQLSAESIFGSGNVPEPEAGAACVAGSATTGSGPYSVALSGSYAYVVNYNAHTMQVFDISGPASPQLVASVATGLNPRFVNVYGNHAYVLNQSGNSMQVFNVSTPSSPALVATEEWLFCFSPPSPISMAISGNYAYGVGTSCNNMHIYDISVPASPIDMGVANVGDSKRSITVSGNYLYITRVSPSELSIYDISNPTAPAITGTVATGTEPVSVTVSGDYAYLVNVQSSTLQVFNVSDPSAPVLVSTTATGTAPRNLCLSGNNAFVVTGDNTLQRFDISDPTSPSHVSDIVTGADPRWVAVQGNIACVASAGSDALLTFYAPCPQLLSIDPVTGGLATQNGGTLLDSKWTTNSSDIHNNNIGNVGIGTSSPTDKLHVNGSTRLVNTQFGNGITINAYATGDRNSLIDFRSYDSGNNQYGLRIIRGPGLNGTSEIGHVGSSVFRIRTWDPGSSLRFNVANQGDKMTLLENGNVGIGTTSPAYTLDVSGTARITGNTGINGFLGVGTNSPGLPLTVQHNRPNSHVALIENTFNNPGGPATNMAVLDLKAYGQIIYTSPQPVFTRFYNSSNLIGRIYTLSDGFTVGYATTSDIRLKTSITDTRYGLQDLMRIRVADYVYKGGEGGPSKAGFLAQQLHEHFPQAVKQGGDDPKEDPWMVEYGALTPLLVKAIQDQQELIHALTARIEALEALNTNKDAALIELQNQLAANNALMRELQTVLSAQTSK